ncbi:hypothetical protein [Holdemania filiformis]|uniref:hypothetical protein n=1 Tax=Holdemania filiformis TaxID=61171 RepID=UPI00267485E7|nr:hypothetical protein [Holdemania filiformis]
MNPIEAQIEELKNKDQKTAYQALKHLLAISETCAEVSYYFDKFVALLQDPQSYVRTRGLLLIAANARWVKEKTCAAALPFCLELIQDPKPITRRQCIQALPSLSAAHPSLKPSILAALTGAQIQDVPETMQRLIVKDIQKTMQAIQTQTVEENRNESL